MNRIKRVLDFRLTRPGLKTMKASPLSKVTKKVGDGLIEVYIESPRHLPGPREIELFIRAGDACRFAVSDLTRC